MNREMKNRQVGNCDHKDGIRERYLPRAACVPPTNYSKAEKEATVEVFKILIRVRDRSREKGLIDW